VTVDLRTRYLGLELRSPLVASPSPLTGELDSALQLVDAGAAAIVLPSLFEEEILHEETELNRSLEVGADQFAEALLRAGEGAYLRGDSVLALFGLADVNPRKVRVVAPKRTRAKLPAFMEVSGPPPGEAPHRTRYEGLLAMRVADAILDCRGRIEPSRLREASRDARKEGLVTRAEYARLQREFRKPPAERTAS